MYDCDSATTPSLEGAEPCLDDCTEVPTERWDVDRFIGNCLWLITCTRPDIQKQLKPL